MQLRIVVWNCNMRLHGKVARLRALRPDIAVVPESACPEVLLRRSPELAPADFAWEGFNPRKGLGVLAFGPWRLRRDGQRRDRVGTTLPLHVLGPARFRLLAVWALPPGNGLSGEPAREPLRDGLRRLTPFLSASPAIVAGDFNHTLVTRRRNDARNPSTLSRKLEALGFTSAYHLSRGVRRGEEREGTFWRYRKRPGRFHSDQLLLDRLAAEWLERVEIGPASDWICSSDHLPLVVDLETRSVASLRDSLPP